MVPLVQQALDLTAESEESFLDCAKSGRFVITAGGYGVQPMNLVRTGDYMHGMQRVAMQKIANAPGVNVAQEFLQYCPLLELHWDSAARPLMKIANNQRKLLYPSGAVDQGYVARFFSDLKDTVTYDLASSAGVHNPQTAADILTWVRSLYACAENLARAVAATALLTDSELCFMDRADGQLTEAVGRYAELGIGGDTDYEFDCLNGGVSFAAVKTGGGRYPGLICFSDRELKCSLDILVSMIPGEAEAGVDKILSTADYILELCDDERKRVSDRSVIEDIVLPIYG